MTPVLFDDKTYEVQTFEDGAQRVVAIDDRYYKAYRDGDAWYFMVRAGHPRSIRGPWSDVLNAIVEIHHVYKGYEQRVRRAKEEAQRTRDRRINEVAERVSMATHP